jgi:protein SCO1/2
MNEVMKPLALCLLVLALAAAGCSGAGREPPLKGANIGGPFTLIDQNGRTVRDSDFAGRYRLIYFGYSYCPDVCPTDLQAIGQAMRAFEKESPGKAAKVQPIFITVDPERDTPAVLKSYVAAFHPRLIGLTGTAEQIEEVRSEFAIFASVQPTGKSGEYLVNHSRMAFLFGPDDQPITLVPQDQGPKAIVETLEEWVR